MDESLTMRPGGGVRGGVGGGRMMGDTWDVLSVSFSFKQSSEKLAVKRSIVARGRIKEGRVNTNSCNTGGGGGVWRGRGFRRLPMTQFTSSAEANIS